VRLKAHGWGLGAAHLGQAVQAEVAAVLGVSRQTAIFIENSQYLPSLLLTFGDRPVLPHADRQGPTRNHGPEGYACPRPSALHAPLLPGSILSAGWR
jgi:hypothetical protein